MRFVLFTKHWKGVEIENVCAIANELGVEGLDMTVRAGYPVNPENVRKSLPQAVRKVKAAGLSVPMITTEGSFLWPDQPDAEPTFAAMAEAGVGLLKLGYYRFLPEQGQTYWPMIEKVRNALDGFQKLAQKYGVKVCYHTHSGHYIGLNACSLMHMIRGFDPQYIGAYLDAAHLFVNGEPYRMALDIVGEYLSIVAVKDVEYVKTEAPDGTIVKKRWLPSGKGMVNFDELFTELLRARFPGPVTIHGEYEMESESAFLAALKEEVAFLKAKLAKCTASQPR